MTEQRPDVLGPTVPELGAQDLPRVPKTAFSMVGAAGPLLGDPKIRSVLLCGIEAQACILVRGHPEIWGDLGGFWHLRAEIWRGNPEFGGSQRGFWGLSA